VSTHKINGQKWSFAITEKGCCRSHFGSTWYADRSIVISPKQSKKQMINTIIHEVLHASFPQIKEEEIKNAADSCTEILRKYKNKWRK